VSGPIIFHESAELQRLPNGFTVLMERLPHLHSAAIGLWMKVGSANETVEECGMAHFLEHLFFKGTKTRKAHDLMAAIEHTGGQINAFTSRDCTCIYVKCLGPHVATSIDILADMARNSIFHDLEKERNVILEEIATIEDTPDDYVHDLSAEQHWPNHPMGRPVTGYHYSVAGLDRDLVEQFFQRWYAPGNMVLSIAGNFDEEQVLEQATALFGDSPGAAPMDTGKGPVFTSGIETVHKEIAQAHVCIHFPSASLHEPERYACDTISGILGGGSTSRLFERIREDEGLAYSIYAHNSAYATVGTMGIYAAIAPANYHQAMDIIFEELRKMREEAVTEEELETNRAQIKAGILMSLEKTSARMGRLAKSYMNHGRIVSIDEVIARYEAVTAEDVQAVAASLFRPDSCAVLTLGPTGGKVLAEAAL